MVCQLMTANINTSLLLPSLFEGSPLFSSTNLAQQSKESFRFQMLYENRFLIKDLSPKFVSFEKSFTKHQWNLSFSDWGSKYYKERAGQLIYAMKLSPSLSAGIGTLVLKKSQFNSDALLIQIFPSIGFEYRWLRTNRFFTSFQLGTSKNLYYKSCLGLSHKFASNYHCFLLVTSSSNDKVLLSAGIKHERKSGNEFMLQVNSNNYPIAVAYKIAMKQFSLRLSMYYHLQLGMSNHIGIGYQSGQ